MKFLHKLAVDEAFFWPLLLMYFNLKLIGIDCRLFLKQRVKWWPDCLIILSDAKNYGWLWSMPGWLCKSFLQQTRCSKGPPCEWWSRAQELEHLQVIRFLSICFSIIAITMFILFVNVFSFIYTRGQEIPMAANWNSS